MYTLLVIMSSEDHWHLTWSSQRMMLCTERTINNMVEERTQTPFCLLSVPWQRWCCPHQQCGQNNRKQQTQSCWWQVSPPWGLWQKLLWSCVPRKLSCKRNIGHCEFLLWYVLYTYTFLSTYSVLRLMSPNLDSTSHGYKKW